MLAGLMLTEKEPHAVLMNSLLEKFNEQILALNFEGMKLKIGNLTILFKFKPLCLVADSAAQPILQNRLQYNAYDSCSWCYQHGYHSGCIRFPFDPDFSYRSHESHLNDVYDAQEKQSRNVNMVNL